MDTPILYRRAPYLGSASQSLYVRTSSLACSQAIQFLARTANLSLIYQTAYVNLICGLVADGVWSKLDGLYVLATKDTTTANINLVSSNYSLTQTGSVTFTVNRGYTGDGATGYLDTGFVPSVAGGNFSLNSGSLGAYDRSHRTVTNDGSIIGAGLVALGSYSNIEPYPSSNQAFFRINETGPTIGAVTSSQGMWIASRVGASTINGYLNGNPIINDTAASAALNDNSIKILAIDFGSGLSNFSNDQVAAAFMGGGLTDSDALNISNRLNLFMISVGASVY